MLSSFALAWSSFPAMKIKGSIDWTIGLPKAPNMGSVAPVVSDCLSPRKPFERLAHGWSFPRLDIFSPTLMERRQCFVCSREHFDLLAIVLKLARPAFAN
jgi:hypothetical protein